MQRLSADAPVVRAAAVQSLAAILLVPEVQQEAASSGGAGTTAWHGMGLLGLRPCMHASPARSCVPACRGHRPRAASRLPPPSSSAAQPPAHIRRAAGPRLLGPHTSCRGSTPSACRILPGTVSTALMPHRPSMTPPPVAHHPCTPLLPAPLPCTHTSLGQHVRGVLGPPDGCAARRQALCGRPRGRGCGAPAAGGLRGRFSCSRRQPQRQQHHHCRFHDGQGGGPLGAASGGGAGAHPGDVQHGACARPGAACAPVLACVRACVSRREIVT